jgi:hypothetical protein
MRAICLAHVALLVVSAVIVCQCLSMQIYGISCQHSVLNLVVFYL